MSARSSWQHAKSRYRYRVVAGVLVAALPMMILIGFRLTQSTSSSLTASAEHGTSSVAAAVTLRLEDWISERRESMSVIAVQASGQLAESSTTALLVHIDKTYADFDVIEIVDLKGSVVASSRTRITFEAANRDWFRAASAGKPALTTITNEGGHLRWVVAEPILAEDGTVEGVVAGDLDEAVLAEVLNPELPKGTDVTAVDRDPRLIYDTSMGKDPNAATMIAGGALRTKVDNAAVNGALSGRAGSTSFTDHRGRSSIGGYDALNDLGWAILVSRPKTDVLAPVARERTDAIWLVLVGACLATLFALWFAGREARYLRALADEGTNASTEVTASAAQLS
jgi:methyl-accepting chemotaxis protein